MERLAKVEDLVGSPLDPARAVELRLPVERGFHGVLDRRGSPRNEEQMRKLVRNGEFPERPDEGGKLAAVNVAVRRIRQRRPHEGRTKILVQHAGVVVPDRQRRDVRVAVQVLLGRDRIDHDGAVRGLEINDDVEAVDQDVGLQNREDFARRNGDACI